MVVNIPTYIQREIICGLVELTSDGSLPIVRLFLWMCCFVIFLFSIFFIGRLKKTISTLEKIVKAQEETLKDLREQIGITSQELKILIALKKQASLGLLTAGIAHEIKNPINIITNFASLSIKLEEEIREAIDYALKSLPSEEAQNIIEDLALLVENMKVIKEQTVRLDILSEALLSKPGRNRSNQKPIDMGQLLNLAYKLVIYSKKQPQSNFKVKLLTDYDTSLPDITVISSELTQAFINIIDNAYEALLQKHVLLPDFKPTIKLITKNLEDKVEIIIEDNGNGIDAQIREQLFQPFVTGKSEGKGSGLGLSIAHEIVVDRHGGELRYETQSGEGTKFFIILPK